MIGSPRVEGPSELVINELWEECSFQRIVLLRLQPSIRGKILCNNFRNSKPVGRPPLSLSFLLRCWSL